MSQLSSSISPLIILSREEAFRYIGFTKHTVYGQDKPLLHGPELDSGSLEAPANRAKLLRAWAEMGTWYAYFTKQYGLFPCLPIVNLGFSNGFLYQQGKLDMYIITLGPQSRLNLLKTRTGLLLVYIWNNVSAAKSVRMQLADSRLSVQ